MTYATQQDLVDRFGSKELIELTDRATPPAGAIDATVVAKAVADADAEINGYLGAQYTLPLADVPTNLARVAGDIARYYLYEDRATAQVKERYDAAIGWLDKVAKGTVKLGPDSGGDAPASTGGPAHQANDRTFSVGKPSTGSVGTLDDY